MGISFGGELREIVLGLDVECEGKKELRMTPSFSI